MAGSFLFSAHSGNLQASTGEKVFCGNVNGNIVASLHDGTVALAVGKKLFSVNFSRGKNVPLSAGIEPPSYAEPMDSISSKALVRHGLHSHNIVTVAAAANEPIVATVDAHGNGRVSSLSSMSAPLELAPPKTATAEAGWAGIAVCPGLANCTATALQFKQTVTVYDGDRATRTMHALHPLLSLCYIQPHGAGTPLLATTERNQLAVWDPRMAERGGCVTKVMPSNGQLYTVAGGANHIAVGGADRTVYVYDSRVWRLAGACKGLLKFDIGQLFFYSDADGKDSNVLLAGKVDGEVATAPWVEKKASGGRLHANNFRGDSRWIGMTKMATGANCFAGVTTNGTLYSFESLSGNDMAP